MFQSKYKALFCILVVLALFLAAGCASEMPEEEMPVSGDPYNRTSVVYYEQESGYLVPVYVSEPWSDDIAEVLLEKMVASDALQVQLEEVGLSALLPADTTVSVSMDEGLATVNLQSGWLSEVSAKRGANIVSAVVNTMAQFPAVEQVQLQVNGVSETFGKTDISEPVASMDLNPAYAKDEGFSPLTVFYKTADSGLIVPVTKYSPDIDPTVVLNAMMKEHKDSALMTMFPEDTKLLSADLSEDGVLTVDFSQEFSSISTSQDKEQKLLSAIDFACKQVDGVEKVVVLVEGEEYQSAASTMSPIFANEVLSGYTSAELDGDSGMLETSADMAEQDLTEE